MADYSMNYGEIGKQHGVLTQQMDALARELDAMVSVEDSMLDAAKWSAEDKKEFTDRFDAYVQGGRNLQKTGVSQAQTLKQVSDTYHSAEQR